MGDRTFSAEDVIRIFQDFLTVPEQLTVEEFFMPEEIPDNSLIPFVAVRNLIAVLDPLLLILASFPIAILTSLFAPARIALRLVIPLLASILRILRAILATEGDNA